MDVGSKYKLQNAGYRAFYSLACEKGQPLLDYDLRADDTPIEANLEHLCRKNGTFLGADVVEKQRKGGVNKRLVFITIDENIPLWGLEGVYRNGESVGFVRRADYGFAIDKSIGKAYIKHTDGKTVDDKYLTSGQYELKIKGVNYPAKVHLKSPFDADNQRSNGFYN